MIKRIYFSGVHEHYYDKIMNMFNERKSERDDIFQKDTKYLKELRAKNKRDICWAILFVLLGVLSFKTPLFMCLDFIVAISHVIFIMLDKKLMKRIQRNLIGNATLGITDTIMKCGFETLTPKEVFEIDNIGKLFPDIIPFISLYSGDVISIIKRDDKYQLETSKGLQEFTPTIVRDNPDCIVCNSAGIILSRMDLVKVNSEEVIDTEIEINEIPSEEISN